MVIFQHFQQNEEQNNKVFAKITQKWFFLFKLFKLQNYVYVETLHLFSKKKNTSSAPHRGFKLGLRVSLLTLIVAVKVIWGQIPAQFPHVSVHSSNLQAVWSNPDWTASSNVVENSLWESPLLQHEEIWKKLENRPTCFRHYTPFMLLY